MSSLSPLLSDLSKRTRRCLDQERCHSNPPPLCDWPFRPEPPPCWPAPLLKWHRGKAVRFKRRRSGQTWADARQTQTQQAEHWRTIVGTKQTWKGITILAPRTASWMRLLRWRRRARMRMGKLSGPFKSQNNGEQRWTKRRTLALISLNNA